MISLRFLALAALFSAQASAIQPAAPAPGARWVSDWGDRRCGLVRTAADGHTARLSIFVTPGAWSFSLWFSDLPLGGHLLPVPRVEISFEPSGTMLSDIELESFRNGRDTVHRTPTLDESHLDVLAMTSLIRVRRNERVLEEIAVPGARGAVTVLRECITAQLRAWGIDAAFHANLRSRPKPVGGIAARWFRPDDYPMEAFRAGREGTVIVRLSIGSDGSIRECAPVAPSGVAELDARTCRILTTRGRYEPAIDSNGAPVPAMATVLVNWRLP